MAYNRILEAVIEKPWAILPSKLTQISELLILRHNGGFLSDDEIRKASEAEPYHQHYLEARAARNQKRTGGKIAVIPVYGVITPKANLMTAMSGGTGMDEFMQVLGEVAADSSVSQIVLDIDSPGGQVDLIPEAAAMIRQVRAKKPVVAVANTMAASAAYWLASQASSIVISPSAEVGSIGVYAAHNDISKAQENLGIKTTLISAGKYKTELDNTKPLTDEARAYVQGQVDRWYAMFTKDVAAGRGVSVDEVRSNFGQGRMVMADEAVKLGMADKVDTFDTTVSKALSAASQNPMIGASSNFWISPINTTGTSTNFDISQFISNEITPLAEIGGNFQADEDSVSEPAEAADAISDLDSLRREARETATKEREHYLSLLRRVNK